MPSSRILNGPKIVLQDPRTSAPGLGFLLWMRQVYGDKAGEAWTKLKPRIVTFTKGWSEAYGLFLKGEADMVMSYTTSPAYHVGAEKKTNYKAAPFAEGHYMHVELAGADPHRKAAGTRATLPRLRALRSLPVGDARGQLDVPGQDRRPPGCRPPSPA